MYHVTDPLLSLRVCYNLLKPGGILLIETEGAKGKELTLNYQGKTNKGNNWYSPTTSTMQQMLEDMGFEMSSASEADILTYTAPGRKTTTPDGKSNQFGRLMAAGKKGAKYKDFLRAGSARLDIC